MTKLTKLKKPVKRRLIATAALGFTAVRLFADTEISGGSFSSKSDTKRPPEIVVGVDQNRWWECLAILQHEAMELMLAQMDLRYVISGVIADNSADYYFWMNHQEFAEVCAQVAYFLAKTIPPLSRAWKEYDTYRRKKGRSK